MPKPFSVSAYRSYRERHTRFNSFTLANDPLWFMLVYPAAFALVVTLVQP